LLAQFSQSPCQTIADMMIKTQAMNLTLLLALWSGHLTTAARQPYDVRKIIQAFREPHDDLVIICAHRGQR
jgi:pyridoxal/pyridoxine/pyridoxamine kinase